MIPRSNGVPEPPPLGAHAGAITARRKVCRGICRITTLSLSVASPQQSLKVGNYKSQREEGGNASRRCLWDRDDVD